MSIIYRFFGKIYIYILKHVSFSRLRKTFSNNIYSCSHRVQEVYNFKDLTHILFTSVPRKEYLLERF